MRRWALNLVGLACLAVPALMPQLGMLRWLGANGGSGAIEGTSPWLSFSISAGTQLINWGPALIGALIIYFANRRRE